MKQFFEMIPPGFIKSYQKQKNYVDMINGHRVLFRPLDDQGKARSLNLSCFHIEEASEVNYDYFVQLTTRLRNHATDNHLGILSTNPDIGWIRTEFLLKSAKIHNSDQPYYVPEEEKNIDYSTHIAPTRLNVHLPIDFYASTARGKESWWIARYLNGSFSYAEGAVYKTFSDHIVQPFDIQTKIKKEGWYVYGGADFGILDPTTLLMVAIDPVEGIAYVYDEYTKNTVAVPKHAEAMKEKLDWLPHGSLRKLVADPSGKRKNIADNRSIFDHYSEYGIYFQPGDNRIDAGIAKVQAYFMLGRLKVFSSCVHTIKEGINYKYKPLELDSSKAIDEKPIDKDNHLMDPLRYICQELPDDPDKLVSKSYKPSNYFGPTDANGNLPFALRDNQEKLPSGTAWYSIYY